MSIQSSRDRHQHKQSIPLVSIEEEQDVKMRHATDEIILSLASIDTWTGVCQWAEGHCE